MKFYKESAETSSKGYSGIGILRNVLVLICALIERWDLGSMMVIHWAQSVIIGFFNFLRILLLRSFSTEGFTSKGARGRLQAIGFDGSKSAAQVIRFGRKRSRMILF